VSTDVKIDEELIAFKNLIDITKKIQKRCDVDSEPEKHLDEIRQEFLRLSKLAIFDKHCPKLYKDQVNRLDSAGPRLKLKA
jgi:hypothetical protein